MTLTEIVEQLRACNYECEAGKLEDNLAWVELVKMVEDEESPVELVDFNEERLLELLRTT